jgi:hypothetical protein
MSKASVNVTKTNLTKPKDASRVQGVVAKANGGAIPKGSFVGRMQNAADRNFGKSGGK